MLDVEIDFTTTAEYKKEYNDQTDLRFLANAKRKNRLAIPEYRQVFSEENGFTPYLTVLDLIFNLGPEALPYLQSLDLKF